MQHYRDGFRTFRNLYNSLVKKAKSIAVNHKNSKKIWQVINEACNKRTSSCTIDKLKIGDSIISDKDIIANSFNDHFAEIGIKTTSSIPITDANFRDFLPPPSPYSLFMAPTAPGEILEVILNIDKKKWSSNKCGFRMFVEINLLSDLLETSLTGSKAKNSSAKMKPPKKNYGYGY